MAPVAQGSGIGRRLIDHGCAEAHARGSATLRLYTNAKMTDNIALYRHHGFVETSRETRGNGTIVHMSIDIPAHSGLAGLT